MFIIENYSLAVVFCFITMLCWGSWGNTQKLAGSRVWRYELYYWDYVIGVLLLSLLAAFTMGSVGNWDEVLLMICCRLTHLIWLRLLSGCHIQPFQYSTFCLCFYCRYVCGLSIGSRAGFGSGSIH